MFCENDYENNILELLKDIGYSYISSEELITMRSSLSATLLISKLEESIKKINVNISQPEVNEVIDIVRRADNIDLIKSNQTAVDYLINGVKVFNKKEKKTITYKLVDFKNIDNNNYIVTNQFKMTTNHPNYDNQYPDIVIYINGLPISVIELKSPTIDAIDSTDAAFKQVKNYQLYLTRLFTWNIFNVISNMHINRYGSLTADYSRYSNFKSLDKDVVSDYKFFYSKLYDKKMILSILNHFTFYTIGDDPEKIIAGYHQIFGVNDTSDAVINAMNSGDKKAGIFWHTQGSGKSFSMVFLTRYVNNIKKKLTTIIVTDRQDLDVQLTNTFKLAGNYLGQEVKQISSIQDLKDSLKNKQQNGVYLCTVQKFDESVKLLSNRNDILIISDEAHRSHKNLNGRIEILEDEFKIEKKFGHAYYLRQAFPEATFLGFTGTPIESLDHQTRQIFGGYTSKYLMSNATEDGFVVPIKYESRHAKLVIAKEKEKQLNDIYVNLKRELTEGSELKHEVQKKLNKSLQKIDLIVGDKDRIEEIAKDFVEHYNSRKNLLKGKSMFVAYNREIAFKYYKEIIKIDPTLQDKIRLIITANNQKDSPEMIELIKNDKYRKESATAFKDPNSDFKIAIVVDMWLTGFDVPCLDTLYIDKPIKMHNLMQTIARVNRTYVDKDNNDLVKESGLIVDYIGIWKKLEEALLFYDDGNGGIGELLPEEVDIIKEKVLKVSDEVYTELLDNEVIIDSSKTKDKQYLFEIVSKIQNIVSVKRIKQQFVDTVKNIKKAFPSILTVLTNNEKVRIQLLTTSRSFIIKRELGDINFDIKTNRLKQMIAEAIIHNKTIVRDNIDNEEITLKHILDILNKKFTNGEKGNEADFKLTAIKFCIKKIREFNIVQSDILTSKLKRLLEKYDSGQLSLEEFIKNMNDLAVEMTSITNEFENDPRDSIEISFYEIMKADEISKSEFDKMMISKITSELYNKVKPMLNKTWLYNEQIKQSVRAEMKKILVKHGYPPGQTPELQKKLIEQLQGQIHSGVIRLEE